jgi:uncharacterized integral membrane protein
MEPEAQAVANQFQGLTAAQQKQVVRSLADPGQSTANTLWLMIVGGLIVLLLGGVGLLYLQIDNGKDTSVILPLVTAALTAIVGLLAPSPVAGKG